MLEQTKGKPFAQGHVIRSQNRIELGEGTPQKPEAFATSDEVYLLGARKTGRRQHLLSDCPGGQRSSDRLRRARAPIRGVFDEREPQGAVTRMNEGSLGSKPKLGVVARQQSLLCCVVENTVG